MDTNKIRRALMTLAATVGIVLVNPASADINLDFGIYAPDEPVRMMWECEVVVEDLQREMSRRLDEDVFIELRTNESYDRGIADMMHGEVQIARFPNMENYWVMHPALSERVKLAWKAALVELRYEEILPLADPSIFVEGGTYHCPELQRLAGAGSGF